MLKNLGKQDLWLQNAVLATGYFGKAWGRNILHILSLENHRNCIRGEISDRGIYYGFRSCEFVLINILKNLLWHFGDQIK